MKKACLLLSVLLACLLITACGKVDPASQNNQDNNVPPVSDNNDKDAVSDSTPPADNKDVVDTKDPDGSSVVSPPDSTDTNDNVENSIIWPDNATLDSYSCGTAVLERYVCYTGWDKNGEATKEFSVVQKMDSDFARDFNYILMLTDDGVVRNPYYKFEFTVDFSEDDKGAITVVYGREINKMTNCIGIKDGENTVWLKQDATGFFEVLCSRHGLTSEDFLFLEPITGLMTYYRTTPYKLEDKSKEKTPEQAAREILLGILEEFSTPAPNRSFVVTSYTDWPFELYDNTSSPITTNDQYYTFDDLEDGQWGVVRLGIQGEIEGPRSEGYSVQMYVLEYDNGAWWLWAGKRPEIY